MASSEKEQYCASLLRDRYAELQAAGEERYPKRADFSVDEVVAIKACFGPWPRALEAAGVKPVNGEKAAAKQQKRIAKKRAATQRKTAEQAAPPSLETPCILAEDPDGSSPK